MNIFVNKRLFRVDGPTISLIKLRELAGKPFDYVYSVEWGKARRLQEIEVPVHDGSQFRVGEE